MSESQVLPSPDPRRLRWLRIASRIGGTIAVVLGGWSLWLAFSTVETPERFEALEELRDAAEKTDDLPDWLEEKPRRPRPAVQITEVATTIDDDQPSMVEPAGFVSVSDGAQSNSIEMAGYVSDASDEPAASAAWLTGEIEDVAAESLQRVPHATEEIPAWKRSTKSLKATLHSTRSAMQR